MNRIAAWALAAVMALNTAHSATNNTTTNNTTPNRAPVHQQVRTALRAEIDYDKEDEPMKKGVYTVLMAAMCAASLTLTGCGGDGGEGTAVTTTTTTSTTAIATTTTTGAVETTYITVTGEDGAAVTDADGAAVTSAIAIDPTTTATDAATTAADTTTTTTTTTATPVVATTQAPVAQPTTTTAASNDPAEQTKDALLKALTARGGNIDGTLTSENSFVQNFTVGNAKKAFSAEEAQRFWEKHFPNLSEDANLLVSYIDQDTLRVSVLIASNYNDPWKWPCDWQGMEADCKAYVESQGWTWDANLNVDKGSWAGRELTYNQVYSDQFEVIKELMHLYYEQSGDTYFKCVFIPDEETENHYYIYIVHAGSPTTKDMVIYGTSKEHIELAKKAVN